MEAWRQWLLGGRKNLVQRKNNKIHLTPAGLLMEGVLTSLSHPQTPAASRNSPYRKCPHGKNRGLTQVRSACALVDGVLRFSSTGWTFTYKSGCLEHRRFFLTCAHVVKEVSVLGDDLVAYLVVHIQ